MASESYMVARPPPPGALKRAVDRVVLPASINLIYRGEMLVENLAEHTKRAPAVALLAALGCGYLVRAMTRRA